MSFVAHPKQTHSEKEFLRNVIQPACLHAKLLQLYLTLCNPMDYNPPGSSVHGISQARILEWVATSPPADLLKPGIEPTSPTLAGGFFTTKPPGKPLAFDFYFLFGCAMRHVGS